MSVKSILSKVATTPTMGSIPQGCRIFRLFTPLLSVPSVASHSQICSRQRHHERSGVGSSAAVMSSDAALPPADPRSSRSIATTAIKSHRQFAWQVKNRFTHYPHFLREPESADAFAARHADFGSATASRVRCGIDDAQSRSSLLPPSLETPIGLR